MQKKIYLLSAFLLSSFCSLFGQFGISIQSQNISCGQSITVPITVTDFTQVQGLSFSLDWNPNHLSYQSHTVGTEVSSGSSLNTSNTGSGSLGFAWFNPAGVDLSDGATVLFVEFTVNGNSSTTINFVDSPSDIVGTQSLNDVNVSTATEDFTLIDNENPTITCPDPQSATTSNGETSVAVPNISPTVSDNCGIATDGTTYTLSGATTGSGVGDASGTEFNVGTTTVTYNTDDDAGNTNSCSFEVVVTQGGGTPSDAVTLQIGSLTALCNEPITLPVSVNGFDSLTDLSATISWDPNQLIFTGFSSLNLNGLAASDFDLNQLINGTLSFSWDNAIAQTLTDGTVIFNIEFTGDNTVFSNEQINVTNVTALQNNAAFSANGAGGTVNLQDNTPPSITCPNNQTVDASPGQLAVVINNLSATATDNCGSPTISYTLSGATTGSGPGDASGTSFNLGETNVTYTATDAFNNETTCSFTVTVNGLSPEDFTLFIENGAASCADDEVIVEVKVAAFDTIRANQFSVSWNPDVLDYTSHDVGVLTDAGFTTDNVSQGNIGYAWFDGTATGVTLPDGSILFTLRFTPVGGGDSNLNFSNNPVPIEVTDRNFNEIPDDEVITMVGTVTVSDSQAPIITAPEDQIVTLAMGETSGTVNNLDPVVVDDCGAASVTFTLSGATSGSGVDSPSGQTFNAGTTTIIYTATDGGGNSATDTTVVTLSVPGAMEVNVVTPEATCGAPFKVDITVDEFVNGAGIQFSVDWAEAVLQFDSIILGSAIPLNISSDFRQDLIANGQLGFAWADRTGTPVNLENGTVLFTLCYTLVGQTGASSDILITDAPTPKEGSVYSGVIPTPVPLIGNGSAATIVDNSAPVVMNAFPELITLYVPADACTVLPDFDKPTFTDACSDNLTVVRTINGTTFDSTVPLTFGQYKIIYTASDEANNSISDSTNLIIIDTIAPIITGCISDFTVNADVNCMAVANWTPPTATDNCSAVITSSTHNPGLTLTETTTVTYTFSDAFGNESRCSFTITVAGTSPIVFENFPGNIIVNAAQNECGASIGWTSPSAIGGCSDDPTDITITSSSQPGDFFQVGENTIVYTATDTAGVSVKDSFLITVVDNQPMVVICPTDIEIQADGTVLADAGNFINTITSDSCSRYSITFNDIQAFDNCSPISVTQVQGPTSGGNFTFGTTIMEYVFSDTLGNSVNCSFQITINETGELQAATLDNPTCAGSNLRLTVNSLMGGSYQWTGPDGFIANIQNPVIPNAQTNKSGNYVVKVISENGCTIKDSIMVGILSGPEIEASGTDLDCSPGTDTIRLFASVTNGIPVTTYNWTGPGGFETDFQNPIIPNATNSAVGIYIVTGTSGNGCADSDTVVVGQVGMVAPMLSSDVANDTICANSSFTLTGTAYDGLVNYVWSAPEGAGLPAERDTNALVITPTIPGTYTYAYTANLDGGCTADTARYSVIVLGGAGAVTIENNGPFDCVSSNQTIDLTATGGTEIIAYAWTGPNDFTSDEQNPSIPASSVAAGTYNLTATTADGCTASNSIGISVSVQDEAPTVTASIIGNNVCEGDGLVLTGPALTGATYAWTGPNGFTSLDSIISFSNVTADIAGAYQLTTTVNGCTSAPATVGPFAVLTDPVANNDAVEAVRNQNLTFSATENDDLAVGAPVTVTLLSNPDNGDLVVNTDGTLTYSPASNFVGMDQIAYEVCYVDCPTLCDMATITIRTEFDRDSCIVPTFISPNNDGFNDALVISCVPDVPKVGSELIVFNEWGSEVFRESPYQNNWQGTYDGKDLPDGTYYYIFKEDNDDNDPMKGYVTIFR